MSLLGLMPNLVFAAPDKLKLVTEAWPPMSYEQDGVPKVLRWT